MVIKFGKMGSKRQKILVEFLVVGNIVHTNSIMQCTFIFGIPHVDCEQFEVEEFQFKSCVQGHHVHKSTCSSVEGSSLVAVQ